MKNLKLLTMSLFVIFLSVQAEEVFSKSSLISFYATNEGKENLLRAILGKSQEFVKKIKEVSSVLEKAPPFEFGATNFELCTKLIKDYNAGLNDIDAKILWGPCIGLPDGFFDNKNVYPSVASSIFGDWVLGITNSYVPRPLIVEVSKIKMEDLDFFDPMISCNDNECLISLAIKRMSLKGKLLVKELLFPSSIVLDIPDLNLVFKDVSKDLNRDRAGAKIRLVFKFNPNRGRNLPLISIDQSKSQIIIPQDSVDVKFKGSGRTFLELLKRSGAITAKDTTLRTLATGAKNFLDLGVLNDLLNLDSTIHEFLYKKENISTINNLLFPYVNDLVNKAMLSTPLTQGREETVKIGKDIFSFSFNFYKENLMRLKIAHEININVEEITKGGISFQNQELKRKSSYGFSLNLDGLNFLLMKLYDADLLSFEHIVDSNLIKGKLTSPLQFDYNENEHLISLNFNVSYSINGSEKIMKRKLLIKINDGEQIEYTFDKNESDESNHFEKEIIDLINGILMKNLPGAEQILSFLTKKDESSESRKRDLPTPLHTSFQNGFFEFFF